MPERLYRWTCVRTGDTQETMTDEPPGGWSTVHTYAEGGGLTTYELGPECTASLLEWIATKGRRRVEPGGK